MDGLEGLARRESVREVSVPKKAFVKLVSCDGSDLSVVNSARVSFGKRVEEITDRDERLISYLIKNKHTSPLRHAHMTFHIRAPIFVLRQWQKHQVGCSWNEMSGRYVKFDNDVYFPESWRGIPEDDVKQGSGGTLEEQGLVDEVYSDAMCIALASYKQLLSMGVCKEQARLVLPASILTECWWTASLQAVLHFLDLRLSKDAQSEIRDFAKEVESLVKQEFPATYKAWRENGS